jgi:hypothetical protein
MKTAVSEYSHRLLMAASFSASLCLSLPVIAADSATEALPVDCLLPGQVRKIGRSMTYLTQRRPARVAAIECEIRGGEYVSYDRANWATSLGVWLEPAKEGDEKSQHYVGHIFEKGIDKLTF